MTRARINTHTSTNRMLVNHFFEFLRVKVRVSVKLRNNARVSVRARVSVGVRIRIIPQTGLLVEDTHTHTHTHT